MDNVLEPEKNNEVNTISALEPEKPTKKKEVKKATQLMLTEAIRERAKVIGKGNLTRGITTAISSYKDDQ